MVTFYKREPVTHEEMIECRLAQPNSICNVLSRIYFNVDDDNIKRDCRIAVRIAKAMSKRLKNYGDG